MPRNRWLTHWGFFRPDDLAGGGGAPASAGGGGVGTPAPATGGGPSTPAVPPSPAPGSTLPAATPAPAPSGTAGAAPAAGEGGQGYLSPREYLSSLGHQALAGQYNDDAQMLADLARQSAEYRQHQNLLPYAAQYAQHAGQFQEWLKVKQAEELKAREQTQQQNYFKLPDYDPRWLQMVEQDPQTGQVRPKPGAPPDIVQRIQAYSSELTDLQNRLWKDPVGVLGPMIQQIAQQQAQQIVQQHLGGYQQQQEVQGFISQNSSWLHQRDANGQLQYNPATRLPVLSPAGQVFLGHVQTLQARGVTDLGLQKEMALALTQRDLLLAYSQGQQGAGAGAAAATPQQTQQQQQQAANAAWLRQHGGAGRLPAVPGVVPPSAEAAAAVPNAGISLADRLRKKMAEERITDQDIQRQVASAGRN